MVVSILVTLATVFSFTKTWAENEVPNDVSAAYIAEKNLSGVLPESIVILPNERSTPSSENVFIVDKSARSLSVWNVSGEVPKRVQHHPTDLGKKNGDKWIEGDHKTPEGIYFFLNNHEKNELDFEKYGSRAFTTNYPNLFDRREGKTGHGIWLHAIPDTVPLTRGSRGCVVVRDDVIKTLTEYIQLTKTPIIVKSKENYLSISEWKKRNSEIDKLLTEWRKSWENKEIDKYMDFYSQKAFYSKKMYWKQWRSHKKHLAKVNKEINVTLRNPSIFIDGDELVAKFIQDYASDYLRDTGRKTLHLKKFDGNWKIVAEFWKPLQQNKWVASKEATQ